LDFAGAGFGGYVHWIPSSDATSILVDHIFFFSDGGEGDDVSVLWDVAAVCYGLSKPDKVCPTFNCSSPTWSFPRTYCTPFPYFPLKVEIMSVTPTNPNPKWSVAKSTKGISHLALPLWSATTRVMQY
jgi:hypothetical protein